MKMDFTQIVYASSLPLVDNDNWTNMISAYGEEKIKQFLENYFGETVLIYQRRDVMTDHTLKIWQQFNLDFDRQLLKINNKLCQSRCQFFRKITTVLKHQKHLDFLLFLCQQTIFGNILQALYYLFQNYPILIIDSQSQAEINLDLLFNSGDSDISLQINKNLKIVSRANPEIQIKQLTIQLVVMSIRHDKEIHVHINLRD